MKWSLLQNQRQQGEQDSNVKQSGIVSCARDNDQIHSLTFNSTMDQSQSSVVKYMNNNINKTKQTSSILGSVLHVGLLKMHLT